MKREDEISAEVIATAIEVHRALGPGLLESAYEECLARELEIRALGFVRQVPLPVKYKGFTLDCGYRLDLLVEDLLVLELKAIDRLLPVHEAQLLTYLKLSGKKLGLLLNFNVPLMKEGLKRIVNGL